VELLRSFLATLCARVESFLSVGVDNQREIGFVRFERHSEWELNHINALAGVLSASLESTFYREQFLSSAKCHSGWELNHVNTLAGVVSASLKQTFYSEHFLSSSKTPWQEWCLRPSLDTFTSGRTLRAPPSALT
jgi:hypothetical protein